MATEFLSQALNLASVLGSVERVYKALFEISEITSQEIRVKCPDNIGEYSVGFKVKRGISRSISRRKIVFDYPGIKRVSVHSTPFMKPENDAIFYNGKSFEILLGKLSQDTDTFWATIEYVIKDNSFLDNLVQRDTQAESITDKQNEYWIHAQLKNLKALRTNYGRVDLRDVDFLLDVAVHQEIKARIPKPFIKDLEIIMKWISEKDRGKKWELSREHLKQQKTKKYAGKEQEVLRDLQDLFLPSHFATFIEVTQPFHYYDAIRGQELYDNIPFQTFPKLMKIISRTDLSFDKPAAEGKLIYKKNDLQKEISDIFA